MNDYKVYAYVFDDGMTYVGLTRLAPEERDKHHRQKKRGSYTSSMMRYADRIGVLPPKMLVLYDGLSETRDEKISQVASDEAPDLRKQ